MNSQPLYTVNAQVAQFASWVLEAALSGTLGDDDIDRWFADYPAMLARVDNAEVFELLLAADAAVEAAAYMAVIPVDPSHSRAPRAVQ